MVRTNNRRKLIIDLYIDNEIILRLHTDPDDKIGYEEMKIRVEPNGKYTETITVKK